MNYAADLNSINGLIKLPLTNDWSQFASSFPLLLPWYIVLGYAAVLTWTEFERGQALVISALPWVGYYLIWALYISSLLIQSASTRIVIQIKGNLHWIMIRSVRFGRFCVSYG